MLKLLFVHAILLFMGFHVEKPIIMHVYNVGAIFILDNTLLSQQKNHIDVRHHFICDYV